MNVTFREIGHDGDDDNFISNPKFEISDSIGSALDDLNNEDVEQQTDDQTYYPQSIAANSHSFFQPTIATQQSEIHQTSPDSFQLGNLDQMMHANESFPSFDKQFLNSQDLKRIPAFIRHLWAIISDRNTDSFIKWDEETIGVSNEAHTFTVIDPIEFTSHELHKLLKPVSYTYFLRKLEEFGFERVSPDGNTFTHESFRSDNYSLLRTITKKTIIPNNNSQTNKNSREMKPVRDLVEQIAYLQLYCDDAQKTTERLQEEIEYSAHRVEALKSIVMKLAAHLPQASQDMISTILNKDMETEHDSHIPSISHSFTNDLENYDSFEFMSSDQFETEVISEEENSTPNEIHTNEENDKLYENFIATPDDHL